MLKKRYVAMLLALILLLCACTPMQSQEALPTPSPTPQPAPAATPTPAPPPTPEPTPEPEPLHSELYLPHCTVEDMITYFEEVVLTVEYSDGTGEDYLVQKWLNPLYYRMYGTYTDADTEILDALFLQLNAIPGFPGIYPATDDCPENVSISFLDKPSFNDAFAVVLNGEDAYGAVHFWYYLDNNELYSARIGYRTDMEQSARHSVLIEEVINILGITDTVLRQDSITYQYSNSTTALSDVDLVILKMLYSPAIQSGMDAAACRAAIQEMYY